MSSPLQSLVATGTKLWLDSVDPDLVAKFKDLGATGATSNPIIISDLIKTGRFDDDLAPLFDQGFSDEDVAWQMTDKLVSDAQEAFRDAFEASKGDTGYVSFELDPLLEDSDNPLSVEERADRYVELGKQWSKGHVNRMIKVPATPAGLAALERLAAEGITLNVTLIFTDRQYHEAREAIWRGAQRRKNGLDAFKSVYSIFVSRIDVYTKKISPELSKDAQGQVGLLNVKRLWAENNEWWADKNLRLRQEIVFASTGVKGKGDPADKYVAALAGSDIQTNPPETNEKIHNMTGKTFTRTVDQMPPKAVIDEIDEKVDFQKLEDVLMSEGTQKFADPHKALLKLIAEKRAALTAAG
ncbi:MAG: transaldolase [Planctomycetota bacterium]|nr:transaldolase [Planctomycetaceae bacterium]MDQ3329537.1 transaldolase [Planctomycetota bacterium]